MTTTATDAARVRAAKRMIVATLLLWVWMLFGGGALKPGYSHIAQFISELNATGTAWNWQIGWFGFVPFGAAIVAVLVIAAPLLPVRGVAKVGYWLLLAEALAYIGSALAPCDPGCPLDGGSTSQDLHNVLGVTTYLATTVGALLLACGPGLARHTRAVLVAAAVAWFALFAAMVDPSFAPVRGLLQRSAEGVLYGTLLAVAWRGLSSQAMPARA